MEREEGMEEEKVDVGYEWARREKKRGPLYGFVILLVVLVLIGGGALWSYNSLVNLSEAVNSAQAQIESNIQRKADLLPNLVKTVKAYAKHEAQVFGEVARLRSATRLPSGTDGIAKIAALNGRLDGALSRIMAVAERYPDLKASEQFLQLQAQIEGAENRINITRMQYNDAVREYNAALRRIPGRFIAPVMGLKSAAYFEAKSSAKQALKLGI